MGDSHDEWLERVEAVSPEAGADEEVQPDALIRPDAPGVPDPGGSDADDLEIDIAVEADTAETVDPDNAPA